MALVLRKAVLPKNVSLLKCIKGRNLATTANKKNPAVLSTTCPRRRLREKWLPLGIFGKIEKAKRPKSVWRRLKEIKTAALRRCMSCPDLVPETRAVKRIPCRHHSPPPKPVFRPPTQISQILVAPCTIMPPTRAMCTMQKSIPPKSGNSSSSSKDCGPITPCTPTPKKSADSQSKRSYACKCGCPCPFPCGPYQGPCGCLPPPGNCPPKCIQYMTGYYYYPYGFWFCGPYHVSGTCCPVSGCGPCGPCPKCPCPCCICPAMTDATVAAAATIPNFTLNSIVGADPIKRTGKAGFVPPKPQPITPTQNDTGKGTSVINRPSISRFFPFSASVSPNTSSGNASDVKFYSNNAAMNASRSYSTPAEMNECPFYDPNYPQCANNQYPDNYYFNTALPRTAAETVQDMSQKIETVSKVEERDKPLVHPKYFDYSS